MGKFKISSRLRILFFGAVLIPCILLALMAVRSINREEAYIEKRMKETLSAEISHLITRLNAELETIREELNSDLSGDLQQDPDVIFKQWKESTPLVKVPFLLSSEYEILRPRPLADSSEDELAFLNWNRDFITNRATIPVYQNIAYLYKDQITGDKPKDAAAFGLAAGKPQTEADLDAKESLSDAAKKTTEPPAAARKRDAALGKPEGSGLRAKTPIRTETKQQQEKALLEFEENESLRQQVYTQAKEKGQQTLPRTVLPGSSAAQPSEEQFRRESIFISEPRRFSEIISGKENGIIPRFIENKLALLFWKQAEEGRILGCILDSDEFNNRLILKLPELETSGRILTILDENGRPLVMPEQNEARDWRRPLVAREISEILPRWEAAVYLADPEMITSRAHQTALIMWILVILFILSIVTGGTLVLNTLRSEVDLAQKKTSFVANVSHELKTPLTSIRMFAEMLREGRQPDQHKREKYLSLMVSETERLTRLINNVLDFSRQEKGKKQYERKSLELVLLCEDMIESQRLRWEQNGFRIRFSHEPGTAVVTADEEAVKQAVLNLLSNAEKYSPDNKEIEIEVNRTNESALILIKDRGIGIPVKHAAKIFKEFYRIDDSLTSPVRGSGLGLTIAQKIIRDFGGDIHYFPREGGGSVFQISLPLSKNQ